METTFIKGYIDEILLSDIDAKDRELLLGHGYTADENGEVAMSMKFGDGIAWVPNECGLVLRYPKLKEVQRSKKMQREITDYTGRTDCINQFDVALKYGRLEMYHLVADYNLWIMQAENENKDVWALHDEQGHFLFDVFDEDYDRLLDMDIVEEGYMTRPLTDEERRDIQARWGILWTERLTEEMMN